MAILSKKEKLEILRDATLEDAASREAMSAPRSCSA